MAEPAKAAPVAIGVCGGLGILALLFWLLAVVTLSDLAGSDAAGNGYAQAYAAIEIAVLWGLLALISLIAGIKGAIGWPSAVAAFVLIPASGVAAFFALSLLARPELAPFLWPIAIPAAVPVLVLLFAFWALTPPLRRAIPAGLAGGFVWGLVLLLCVAIMPLQWTRDRADAVIVAAREKYDADFAKLPADAPLWTWAPFLNTRNAFQEERVLERIRKLDRRQSDAEIMLDRGDFPLGFLGRIDLKPTAAICGKARASLRRQVEPLVLKNAEAKRYDEIAQPVADALSAMRWLAANNCSCHDEALAWETMAKAYRDYNYDVYELGELRAAKPPDASPRDGSR